MKTIGRLLLLGVLVVAVGILLIYRAPVWTSQQVTHLDMLFSHVQSNYVLTPEGRVHYYEAEPRIPGGGIPLVLGPMLKRLKRAGFHVYAPDLLGYGRSPKPEGSDYSIDTQEHFVLDFIQALGLQKTNIGGWSMGGWITLKLALDHPELIDRVVIYDGVGVTFDFKETKVFHPNNEADIHHLFDLMEPGTKLPPFVARDILRNMQDNQWVIDRGVSSMLTGKSVVDKELPSLKEPMLIVWGKDDHLIPLSVGELMHTMVPTSELDILEGCGHLAANRCAGRAASATADFLKTNPAPQGSVRTLARMQ
jgi:pimeloyl-ACP methyl ester carboxylesterase